MLSGTLASGLLRNMLSGKVVIRAFHGKLLELLKSKELLQFYDLRDSMQRQRLPLSSHFLWLAGHHVISEVITVISYNLCDLQDITPHQRSPLSFSFQLVPRVAQNFPRGGKYSKDVLLPTFLVYLQPV